MKKHRVWTISIIFAANQKQLQAPLMIKIFEGGREEVCPFGCIQAFKVVKVEIELYPLSRSCWKVQRLVNCTFRKFLDKISFFFFCISLSCGGVKGYKNKQIMRRTVWEDWSTKSRHAWFHWILHHVIVISVHDNERNDPNQPQQHHRASNERHRSTIRRSNRVFRLFPNSIHSN